MRQQTPLLAKSGDRGALPETCLYGGILQTRFCRLPVSTEDHLTKVPKGEVVPACPPASADANDAPACGQHPGLGRNI